MKRLAFALSLGAAPALAGGYSDVRGVQIFSTAPCGETIAAIDWADTALPESILIERGLSGLTQDIATSGMMWGILLGYDAKAGGLHTAEQTTLERLRDACAENPDQTARAILDGL